MPSTIRTNYGAYLRSQELLLKLDLEAPVNMWGLLRRRGVLLQTKEEYREWCRSKGEEPKSFIRDAKCFCCHLHRVYLIIYEDMTHPLRMRFSLAHEFAHIALGHLNDDRTELGRGGVPDGLYWALEAEANTFAGNFLAPPVLIYKLHEKIGKIDAKTIAYKFRLSDQASEWRLEDYKIWGKMRRPADMTDVEKGIVEKYWKGRLASGTIS